MQTSGRMPLDINVKRVTGDGSGPIIDACYGRFVSPRKKKQGDRHSCKSIVSTMIAIAKKTDRVEIYEQLLIRRTHDPLSTAGQNLGGKFRELGKGEDVDYVQWNLISDGTMWPVKHETIVKIERVLGSADEDGGLDMILVFTSDFKWVLYRWTPGRHSQWNALYSKSLSIEDFCSEHGIQWSRYNARPVRRSPTDIGCSCSAHVTEHGQLKIELLISPYHNLLYYAQIKVGKDQATQLEQYRPVTVQIEDCSHLLHAHLLNTRDYRGRHQIAVIYRHYTADDELEQPPSTHMSILVADLEEQVPNEKIREQSVFFSNKKPAIRKSIPGPWSVDHLEPLHHNNRAAGSAVHFLEEGCGIMMLVFHSTRCIRLISEDGIISQFEGFDKTPAPDRSIVSSKMVNRMALQPRLSSTGRMERRVITSYIAIDESGMRHHVMVDLVHRKNGTSLSRRELSSAQISSKPIELPSAYPIFGAQTVVCQRIAPHVDGWDSFVCSIFGSKKTVVVELGVKCPSMHSHSLSTSAYKTNYFWRTYHGDHFPSVFNSPGNISGAFVHRFANREDHIVCCGISATKGSGNGSSNRGFLSLGRIGTALTEYTPVSDGSILEGRPDIHVLEEFGTNRSIVFLSGFNSTGMLCTGSMAQPNIGPRCGFDTAQRTVAVAAVQILRMYVQVTDKEIRLIDQNFKLLFKSDSTGKLSSEIIEHAIVCNQGGTTILVLHSKVSVLLLDARTQSFNVLADKCLPSQPSAISLGAFRQHKQSQLLTVSTWIDNEILIYSIPSLEPIHHVIKCDTLICSLQFHLFEGRDYLLAGGSDGEVKWWRIEHAPQTDGTSIRIHFEGSVSIGESPVKLSKISCIGGQSNDIIYANSNSDALLLFDTKLGKIRASRVCTNFRIFSMKEVTTPDFGRCLVYLRSMESRSACAIQFGAISAEEDVYWKERPLQHSGLPIGCCFEETSSVYCVASSTCIDFFTGDVHLDHIYSYTLGENTYSNDVKSLVLHGEQGVLGVVVVMVTKKRVTMEGNSEHYYGTRSLQVFHIARRERESICEYDISLIHRQDLYSGLLFDNDNVRSLHVLEMPHNTLICELNGKVYLIRVNINNSEQRQVSLQVVKKVASGYMPRSAYEHSPILNVDESQASFARSMHAQILSPHKDYLSCLNVFMFADNVYVCCGYLLSGVVQIYKVNVDTIETSLVSDSTGQDDTKSLSPARCMHLVDQETLFIVDYLHQIMMWRLSLNSVQRDPSSNALSSEELQVEHEVETARRQLIELLAKEEDAQLHESTSLGTNSELIRDNSSAENGPNRTSLTCEHGKISVQAIGSLRDPVKQIMEGNLGLQSLVKYSSSPDEPSRKAILLISANGALSFITNDCC